MAQRLNNLASLLHDTNRLADAEPLYRRAVEILERSTRETGHEHPSLRQVRANLAAVQAPRRGRPAQSGKPARWWLVGLVVVLALYWLARMLGLL